MDQADAQRVGKQAALHGIADGGDGTRASVQVLETAETVTRDVASSQWGLLQFQLVYEIKPDRDVSGPIHFQPHGRYRAASTSRLHRYGAGPFCRFSMRGLPTLAGVYVLTRDAVPVYVGECQNLAERWGLRGYGSIQPRNCYSGGQQTNCRINNLILEAAKDGARLELWFRPTDHRKQEEVELCRLLRPAWNAQHFR